jgi:MYXO-CTERM domain-containing protein
MGTRLVACLPAAAALSMMLAAAPARAYTYDSPLSDACHEGLAIGALRAARAAHATAAPFAATEDEQALINDVPFDLPDDLRDLAAATLVIAVRDNDLKGRHPTDTDQLAVVHGDPDAQREHCLRHPAQDEPGGSEPALADCADFIRERAKDALRGLAADGRPDSAQRVELVVWLGIRGTVTASLPRFYVRMGQALHALEDGFTHTFRTSDGLRVTTILNWVEYAEETLVERRDGPPHMAGLDRCDDPDSLRAARRDLAERASRELLLASLDPSLDRAAKENEIDAIVARYLSFEPGCSFDNRWCDAPELAYRDEGACGCRAGRPGGAWAPVLAALAGLFAFLRRRRR